MSVTPDQFGQFFHALHGYSPFRWQQRLAQQVAVGDWPQALALPTASGKTACIDIAIFALACQADWPQAKRTAPRRIFFVVDRRIIVDEAYERTVKIAEKLSEATSDVLQSVADELRRIAGDEQASPLAFGELRGGIYRDNTWAKTPTQPLVICSTVDQIGSRLLFRGYGLGPGMRVVHAGLVANDALIILDEAHCARPFYQTGQAIRRYREWCEPQHSLATPFHFVVMSATPPVEIPQEVIFPDRDVWNQDLAEPDQILLRNRIEASKPANLVVAPREPAKSSEKLAGAIVAEAMALSDEQHRRIGIIVNRVATARRIYEILCEKKLDVTLLTGRMRGIDRDMLLDEWLPMGAEGATPGLLKWFGVEATRPSLDHSAFVVATQCLEVGANLDFDVLVTECASLDALRQRFGRLNRGGRAIRAKGVIVIRGDQVDPKIDDPVYGPSLAATWKWLSDKTADTSIDFGISRFESLLPSSYAERSELLASLQMPTTNAPVMLPAHVDCWAQTAPTPAPDPDPAIFLHGPNQSNPEINVCWRSDLSAAVGYDEWIDTLSLCPPSTSECLAVPFALIRHWLHDQGTTFGSLADLETVSAPDGIDEEESQMPTALIWRGEENSIGLTTAKSVRELRPGDTLVLPVDETRAEWQRFGHIPPHNGKLIIDRGDEANFETRGKAVLRLHPALLRDWPECEEKVALAALIASEDATDLAADVQDILSGMLLAGLIPPRLRTLTNCLVKRRPKLFVHPCGGRLADDESASRGLILVGPRRFKPKLELDHEGNLHETFVNDGDSSLASHEIGLDRHLTGVAEFAARFATSCGLGPAITADFGLVGRCHDLGKLDERFQAWLRGGNPLTARVLRMMPLAKSEGLASIVEREQARRRSGYPKGGRHELVSLRLLEKAGEVLSGCADRDLVMHLVGAHHGHCRPFAPLIEDDCPISVTANIDGQTVTTSSATLLERIDSGVADRFWRLVRRYGWWGLAWLEAIFILADHRRSEGEQVEEEERQQDRQAEILGKEIVA